MSNGGGDVATFYDSSYGDTFEGTPTESRQYNRRIDLVVQEFTTVRAYAMFGGLDTAHLSGYDPVKDTLTDEMVEVDGEMKHVTTLSGNPFSIYLELYEALNANGDGGAAALLAPDEPSSGPSDADYAALAQGVAAAGDDSSDDDQDDATAAVFEGDLWKYDF
jgi:hypothetical protein